jgi:hypothetical protein
MSVRRLRLASRLLFVGSTSVSTIFLAAMGIRTNGQINKYHFSVIPSLRDLHSITMAAAVMVRTQMI